MLHWSKKHLRNPLLAISALTGLLIAPAGANAERTKTGILKLTIPNPPGKIDPTQPRLSQDRFVLGLIFETLVRMNAKNEIEPVLARSWQIIPSEQAIVFSLDEGARFSDGKPLTAADVAASIKRACALDSKVAADLFAISGCPGTQVAVEALGAHRVKLRSKGNPVMLLGQLAYAFLFIYKVDGERFIGSGYYTAREETPTTTSLRHNPHYNRLPAVMNEGIDFEFVPKDKTEEVLKRRAYHGTIMQLPSVATFPVPDGFRAHYHDPTVTLLFIMNPAIRAFADVRRRRQIISDLQNADLHDCHQKTVFPANGIIPRGMGGSTAGERTALAAKEMPIQLAASTTVEVYRSIERQNTCDQDRLTTVLKKFNIVAKFIYFSDYDQFFKNWYAGKIASSLELVLFGAREAFPTLSRMRAGAPTNIIRMNDPEYGTMLDSVLGLIRPDDRFALYRRLADRISASALAAPLYYVGHMGMLRDCIHGLKSPTINNPNPFLFLSELTVAPECLK